MKLKYNPIVHDISGKCGTAVYARWRGTPYVRSVSLPRDPNTPAQQAVRSKYSLCAFFYKRLNDSSKKFWNAYRPDQTLSGYNHWFTQNRSPSDPYHLNLTAPHNPDIQPVINLTAVKGGLAHEVDLTWDGGPWPSDYIIDVYTYGDDITQFYPKALPPIPANDYSTWIPFNWGWFPVRVFLAVIKPDRSASGESDAAYATL